MKNFLLAASLVGCIVACNSTDKKSVTDPAAPTAPKAECNAAAAAGCSDAKAECTGVKKTSCCAEAKPQG